MPLPSHIYEKIRRQARQYRANTGREISPGLMSSLLEADLSARYARLAEDRKLSLQERLTNESLDIQREQLRNEAKAATISGAAQLASTGFAAYSTLKGTKTGKSISNLATKGLEVGKGALSKLGLAETASGTLSTALPASAGTFGGTITGAYTGGEISTLGTTAVADSAAAGATTLTSAGSAVLPAVGGFVGGKIGPKVLPLGGETGEKVESGIGGAAAGFVLTGGNPIGAVIGGIVGIVSGGKIICAELVRQGKLHPVVALLDGIHRQIYIDNDTYKGYVKWANPVVRYMQHDICGPIVTFLIKPFAKAWAYEMASRVEDSRKGSLLGKLLKFLGEPICKLIGRYL